MSAPVVLIVEDDPSQRMVIRKIVDKIGRRQQIAEVTNGEEAIRFLQRDKAEAVSAVLCDLYMPEKDGFDVLAWAQDNRPAVPILVLTGSDDVEDIDRAMELGAFDFIPKPPDQERILVSLRNALQNHTLQDEVKRLKRKDEGHTVFEDLIGHDKGLLPNIEQGKKAAQSDIPVLIEGQSGVGKELFARAIHGESERANHPFIAVNCGAIPENLVESTLFGHKKGSFTGAISDNPGKFREANGGTLFLDEVGELPHEVQVKLLRALQQKEIEPVGETRPVPVDVRIVSATNRKLEQEVADGNFREDLFFRLNVFPINIIPLAERLQDIPDLVGYFIEKFSATERKAVFDIAPDALQMVSNHQWTGNVRELENAVFRAVVLCENEMLTIDDFHLQHKSNIPTTVVSQPSNDSASSAITHIAPQVTSAQAVSLFDEAGNMREMADIEWDIIQRAVDAHNGNISKAAAALGVGQSTLYRKISERKEKAAS